MSEVGLCSSDWFSYAQARDRSRRASVLSTAMTNSIAPPRRRRTGTSIIPLLATALASALSVVAAYELRARLAHRRDRELPSKIVRDESDAPQPSSRAGLTNVRETCSALRARYALSCLGAGSPPLPAPIADQAGEVSPERERAEADRLAAWLRPPPGVLAEMGKRCEVRFVSPAIMEDQAPMVDGAQASLLSLSPKERDEVNQTLQLMHDEFAAAVQPLFVSSGRPGTLDEMITEMQARPGTGFVEARVKLARERAGLAAPPPATADLPPGEKFLRLWATAGDAFEQRLAAVLGPSRARQLRFSPHAGPWTSRYTFSGCPSEE